MSESVSESVSDKPRYRAVFTAKKSTLFERHFKYDKFNLEIFLGDLTTSQLDFKPFFWEGGDYHGNFWSIL